MNDSTMLFIFSLLIYLFLCFAFLPQTYADVVVIFSMCTASYVAVRLMMIGETLNRKNTEKKKPSRKKERGVNEKCKGVHIVSDGSKIIGR